MLPPLTPDPQMSAETARLRQSLNWLIAFAAGSLLLYGAAAVILSLTVVAFLALLMGMQVLVLTWLRWQIGRRSLGRIVLRLVVDMIVAILLFGLLLPILLAPLTAGLIMAMTLALPYVETRLLRYLSVATWCAALVLAVLTQHIALFDPLPQWIADSIVIVGIGTVVAVSLLLLWQFHRRQTEALRQTQAANTALQDAHEGMATQVAERTSDLRMAMAELEARASAQTLLLAENERQREAIRELSVPVLPIGASTLVMPLIGALDSQRLLQVQEQALHALARQRASLLLLDITGVPVVDSLVAQGLIGVVQAARLLGARVALVGIRPEVAQSIVGLGLQLSDLETFSDLQGALGRSWHTQSPAR